MNDNPGNGYGSDRATDKERDPNSSSPSGMRARLRQPFFIRYIRRTLLWISAFVGIVWASPLTLAGLLLALPVFIWRGHAQLIRGPTLALLVRGPFADVVLSRHPFGAMTAMALGHVIIAEQQGLSSRVLAHELEHVRQAERWGAIFPFAYLASSAWAGMRGRDVYWHNHFEIAARKAEKHI